MFFLPGSFINDGTSILLLIARQRDAGVPRNPRDCGWHLRFRSKLLRWRIAQIYGLIVQGSPTPMMEMTRITVALGLVSAAVPSLLGRSKQKSLRHHQGVQKHD